MKQMLVTTMDRTLPLYVEMMGWNEWQDEFVRPDGYHCYHWLQTTGGAGLFECAGTRIHLAPNQGVLLAPHVPHRYVTLTHPWSTWYITFNGSQAPFIVSSLGLANSTVIRWEPESPLANIHGRSRNYIDQRFDGMDGSAMVYRFLIDLKRYGQFDNKCSLSQYHVRLMPLIQYLDENYSIPSMSLSDMAEFANISSQQLSYLFRKTTSMSPYQYLIHLRVQKAKEFMINNPNLTIKSIATSVGFQDTSHFVSTFRKLESMPPGKYRDLHLP